MGESSTFHILNWLSLKRFEFDAHKILALDGFGLCLSFEVDELNPQKKGPFVSLKDNFKR